MSWLGNLYNSVKKKLYDWEEPFKREVSSGLGSAYNSAKSYLGNTERNISDYFKPTVDFVQKYPSPLDYTRKVITPKIQDYFSQPEKIAKSVFMKTTGLDAADKLMNDWRSPAADYFKPTEQVRARDLVREAPQATWEAVKQLPQTATRFAISAVEAPKAIATGKASKKYYETPFGKLNSFQSEAQNRVEKGDPLWKAIGNPALDTVLGAGDIMAAAKPILGAAKGLSKYGKVGEEISNIAEDLTSSRTKTANLPGVRTTRIEKVREADWIGGPKYRELPEPIKENVIVQRKVPVDFKSKTFQTLSRPGLTIEDVSKTGTHEEIIAAKTAKAKELVAKQMENQRRGLETAEPGFVSPKVVKAPEKPVLERPQAPVASKTTLPSVEEYVNGKTAPKQSRLPGIEEFVNRKTNAPKRNPVLSDEDPFKGTAFEEPNGGKPYNAFQQRAYNAKQERIGAIKNITTHPQELRAGGYRKAEIERMGVDEAKKKANLLKLGYPKEDIQRMDIDRMKLILKRNVPHETLKNYYQRKHALDTNYLDGVDPTTLKDINPTMTGGRDVFRNFEAAFGENFPKLKAQLLDPYDRAKGNMFSEQEQLTQEVFDNIVKKLGIKKGSELDHAVVAYGEGTMKLPELQELYPKDWKKVVAADEWFRNKYPQLLEELNAVREEHFPTHPLYPESTKIIPQREDYYRHGQDLEGFAGLRNMFESSKNIDPALAASSDVTNPKTRWLSFAQRRKGDSNDFGAVEGYLDYIKNHSYAKHIDPFIQKFKGVDDEAKQAVSGNGFFHETRGLSEELSQKLDPVQQIADSTDPSEIKNILVDKGVSDLQANWMSKELANIHDLEKARTFLKEKLAKNKGKQMEELNTAIAPAERSENKENNFLTFVKNFSRSLAGKTNSMDRPFQENIFGRKAFGILNWANSRVKANVILGKASSTLAQFFNVPQGFASAGARNSAMGLGDSLAGIFMKDTPIKQSSFIKERYFDGYNKFDTGVLDNVKKFTVWMLGVGDEIGTKFIWNSHYRKALNEGIPNAVKYADDWTRKMVGGRGIGEMPLMQQSKVIQLVAPFQLEVNNMWFALRDIAKNDPRKLVFAKKMIEFAVASYLMNRVVKQIRGSDVSFDPINAMVEAYGEYQKEDDKLKGAVKAGGRLAGEVFSNVMGGQSLASFYPEFGFGINKENFPTAAKILNNPRKDFFGEGDPTRFGTGSSFLLGTGIKNPLTGFVLPFGGKQLEATYGGAKTLLKGFAENASGKVMTPVARTGSNIAKGLLFGKNALNEMRDYFDSDGTPLSDLQTEKYKLMGNSLDYFKSIADDRKANNERDALKDGKAPGETQNLTDQMAKLSNGKIYVKSLDKEFRNEKEAGTAIAIDGFLGSDKKYMELDGKFYYKNPNTESGYSSTTIAARNKTLATSSANLELDRAKDGKDLKAWAVAADKKLQAIDTYLQTLDPAIDQDEIDKLTLEKENLIDTAKKYAGYGGFTKGPSAGAAASKAITLSSAKLTTLKNKGNFKGWMQEASNQLNMLNGIISNPSSSELQVARAESKMATLEKQAETYQEYGGFKKSDNVQAQIDKEERAQKRQIAAEERAAERAKANQTTDVKWRYSLVDPEMMKINALIQGTGSKAPITGKKVLPLIVRRPPAVHRGSVRRKR